MKSLLIKTGILTSLFLGFGYEETSAASEWAAKCSSFGEIKKNEDPSFQHINCLLTNAALEADIPPEVVKAVANQESNGWHQFKNGKPVVSSDGGIGIMQITNKPKGYEDEKRLKEDIIYNIEAGVKILNEKYNYKLPKISGAGRAEIENWYFPVMAYNGTKPVNSPIIKSTGLRNEKAYQEQVFTRIEAESFLGQVKLTKFPFKAVDFEYDSNSVVNIKFLKDTYKLTDSLHTSNYLLKKGNQIVVTVSEGNLRGQPTKLSASNKTVPKNAILEVTGEFTYDKYSNVHQFFWFPAKTLDGKSKGFIASSSIKKYIDKTAPSTPTVNTVSDKSTGVTGKAETNATVYIKIGTKQIGKAAAKSGAYSIKIPKQKAGTSISVYAVDAAKNKSASKTVKVLDKTAPAIPTVNKVTSKTAAVAGKGEKGATLYVYNGSKKIGQGTVDGRGAFKVKIKVQKKGSTLKIYAKDKSGNKSKSRAVKVS
ncbi:Ig-like domain-containing protein [Planomicrobium sp. CPCC 101079]|uniref:Ig-like domain-containing protein n=1 Tax=Planomicrobium sp. CPCC 101079 TaxID=2599618 RepID=UPI0011B50552|nr:Ig-like domain-containing protein [Planomicrobium sp. CPCC 101079]TWT01125.1 lytic transglycosylase domain-containing protein [Planomicrobium sp. CPCC 101079]